MSEVNFKSLQTVHESLLQKQQKLTEENQGDFAREVRAYIEQAKKAGKNIASTRERDQVRANLRYWANYIYSIEETFPDTELAPSTVAEKRPIGTIITVTAFFLLILFGAIQTFRSTFSQSTELTNTPIPTNLFATPARETEIPGTMPVLATSTSVVVGPDVEFTSPQNGENVLPRVGFKGEYTNLGSEASIHVLLIRGDKFFPIKDFFRIPQDSLTGKWEIQEVELYQKPEELQQAENLTVVPAACFDDSCRESLEDTPKEGMTSDALPSPLLFTVYRDSSRVLSREAYKIIYEPRIVYSYFDGRSYDLYTAKLDGSDRIRITNTERIDEKFPNLSPDGRQIIYIQFIDTTGKDYYAIRVMDSNGKNDLEIISGDDYGLVSPQWSPDPDSPYISYVMSDLSRSPATYSLYVYNRSTNEKIKIPDDFPRLDNYRYSSWLPDGDGIIFNVGMRETGTSGFALAHPEATESPQVFFDYRDYEDLQPNISLSESGYLLSFIAIFQNDTRNLHDIYMAIDPDGVPPFNGEPVRLIQSTGELLDYPVVYPDSNALYFTKYGSIYRVEYEISGGRIALISESDGMEVIPAETKGDKVEPIYFDIDDMDTFFPIP